MKARKIERRMDYDERARETEEQMTDDERFSMIISFSQANQSGLR